MAEGREELGRRIAEARDSAGLTQPELADRIGLKNGQSISRYERGETEVPMRRLRRIAEETKKPMAFFIDDLEAAAGLAADAFSEVGDRLDRIEAGQGRNEELLNELLSLLRAGQERPPEAVADG